MKHLPVIRYHAAACSCGRMPTMLRPDSESIGAFTIRAYATWQTHVELGTVAQLSMFGDEPKRETPGDTGGPLFR